MPRVLPKRIYVVLYCTDMCHTRAVPISLNTLLMFIITYLGRSKCKNGQKFHLILTLLLGELNDSLNQWYHSNIKDDNKKITFKLIN